MQAPRMIKEPRSLPRCPEVERGSYFGDVMTNDDFLWWVTAVAYGIVISLVVYAMIVLGVVTL